MYNNKEDLDNQGESDLNQSSDTTHLAATGTTHTKIKAINSQQLEDIDDSNETTPFKVEPPQTQSKQSAQEVSNQGNNDPLTMVLDRMKVRPPKKSQVHTSVGSCRQPMSCAGEVPPEAQLSQPPPGVKQHGIHLSKATMSFHPATSCGPITGPSVQQYKPKPHLKVNTSHTGDADEVVHHATVPTACQLIWDRKPPKWVDHDLPTPAKK
ncbi:hypothetical protein J3A83DRAFT_4373239 [Scleroderma citrinum]